MLIKFLLLLATHAACLACGMGFRDQLIAVFKRKSADALAEIKSEGAQAADVVKDRLKKAL